MDVLYTGNGTVAQVQDGFGGEPTLGENSGHNSWSIVNNIDCAENIFFSFSRETTIDNTE